MLRIVAISAVAVLKLISAVNMTNGSLERQCIYDRDLTAGPQNRLSMS
jgi:hypothetical protein